MAWEKSRVARPKKIPSLEGFWEETAIIDDEIIKEIAQQEKANIFITDEAAAAIMCSTTAVYSWDV